MGRVTALCLVSVTTALLFQSVLSRSFPGIQTRSEKPTKAFGEECNDDVIHEIVTKCDKFRTKISLLYDASRRVLGCRALENYMRCTKAIFVKYNCVDKQIWDYQNYFSRKFNGPCYRTVPDVPGCWIRANQIEDSFARLPAPFPANNSLLRYVCKSRDYKYVGHHYHAWCQFSENGDNPYGQKDRGDFLILTACANMNYCWRKYNPETGIPEGIIRAGTSSHDFMYIGIATCNRPAGYCVGGVDAGLTRLRAVAMDQNDVKSLVVSTEFEVLVSC